MADFGIQILGKHVISDRLTSFRGRMNLTSSGSMTLPGNGRAFAYLEFGAITGQRRLPVITIDGTTISWTVNDLSATMIYGVY